MSIPPKVYPQFGTIARKTQFPPQSNQQIQLRQTASTNTPLNDDDNKEKRIKELEENMQMMTTTIIALEEKIRRLEDEMKKPKPQLNDLINKYQELYYKIDELIKLRN